MNNTPESRSVTFTSAQWSVIQRLVNGGSPPPPGPSRSVALPPPGASVVLQHPRACLPESAQRA